MKALLWIALIAIAYLSWGPRHADMFIVGWILVTLYTRQGRAQ